MGVLLSALVTGCYGTNSVFVEPPIDVAPLIEPAQVSVGIYYSEDLRNHKCTADARFHWNFALIGRPRWTFALGPPSIEMFDILFTALFTDVETRDTGPEITSPGDQQTTCMSDTKPRRMVSRVIAGNRNTTRWLTTKPPNTQRAAVKSRTKNAEPRQTTTSNASHSANSGGSDSRA